MIYIICGPSGSGKDTLADSLLECYEGIFHADVGYTTRPKRPGEVDGKTYHFRDEPPSDMSEVIELRSYDTCNGKWYYWHQKQNGSDNIIAISTLDTVSSYVRVYGVENICVIKLDIDPYTAFTRMYSREQHKDLPDYKELCRRFLSDYKMLEQPQLSGVRYYNIDASREASEILAEVRDIIGRETHE